jgi:hypothetical protein
MKTHVLKTKLEFIVATMRGEKLFEIRVNDRDFKIGDRVILKEYPRQIDCPPIILGPFTITYIFPGGQYGLDKHYCILQLKADK